MSAPFRKRRREDLTQYIETDQVQSNLTYDKIGSTIKEACKSLMGFFRTDDGKSLPYFMRADCFYTRTEPYKKRATRPLPPGTLDTLKRIRKGFDPLEMTLSRWKKQNEQAKEEQQAEESERDSLIQRSIARRKIEMEEQPQSAKKIIKTYHIDAEDSNNDLKWELLDKKIQLALDSLQQNNKEDRYQKKGFFEGQNNKPFLKAETVNTDLQKADSQSQPTQSQERHHEIQAVTQNQTSEVLPEKKVQPQVVDNPESETKIELPKPSPPVNPFKNGPSKQPLTLMDMINKHKQAPFISNTESQSQATITSKLSGQNQIINPFQASLQAYTSIQPQQNNQPSPSFSPNFATTSPQQVANNYIINQSNNPFADKASKPQRQFFHNPQDNSTLHQGNHVQSTPSYQNYQKNSINPQQLPMNPLPNTFSPVNVTQIKGMFESSHQTHKDSLGLFDKASSVASDKTKKKGPTYRHRKDNQIRVS